MPKPGDVVFVSEYNDYTGETAVSPAIVTHVYSEDDGDPAWWNAAKDKAIVDATVFRRNGTVEGGTFGKSETVSIDDGAGNVSQFKVGYATSPDGHDDNATSTTTDTPVTPAASVSTPTQATDTANNPSGTADLQQATTGTPTDTVGDGTAPNGSTTNADGSPSGV